MEDRAGETLDGRYRLDSLLGEGGMGAVYTASHLVTGRKVAIKFLLAELADNTEAVGRFFREARAATAIKSEHICEVLDMRPPEEGTPYLVMEYLEGESLKEHIQRLGRVPMGEAVNIMVQVLEALHAAHKAGIVHRDIKPDNLFLVSREGKPPMVKLLDFGISKFNPTGDGGEDHSLTRTGTVLGTPYYMSPEQASGERTVGPISDLYAVGVMLYEVLTGGVPFDADSFSALVVKIVCETPMHPCQRVPELPQAMGDLVMKAMAREQSVRFNTAAEFSEALRAVAMGQAISVDPVVPSGSSFDAVSFSGPSGMSGASGIVQTQIYGDAGSQASGIGGVSGASGVVGTQTPMAMERSVDRPPKTWLFVGVGAVVTVLLIVGVGGAFLLPQFLEEPAPAPPVAPPLEQVAAAVPGPAEVAPTPPTPPTEVGTAPVADAGAPTVAADAAPATVRVTFAITPSSASVFLDGREVDGGASGSVEIPADGASHALRATARGYVEQRQEFTADEDRRIAVTLVRARRAPSSTPPAGPVRPTKTGGRGPIGVVNPWGN